jgi:hypothetical protein
VEIIQKMDFSSNVTLSNSSADATVLKPAERLRRFVQFDQLGQ